MMNLTPFKLPSTATCILVWVRGNKTNHTTVNTPRTHMGLRDEAIKHGIGYSEIRTVKADPNGRLLNTDVVNPAALQYAMTAF